MQHDQLEKQLQGKEKIHDNLYSVQMGHKANSNSDLKCCTTFADCWLQNIDFIELRPKYSPQVCKYHTLEYEITVLLKNHFRKPKKQLLHCLSLWALICLAVTFYWVSCFEFVLVSWYMRTEPFGHSIGNPWGIFEGNISISKHNYMYIHCAVICWNIKNVN